MGSREEPRSGRPQLLNDPRVPQVGEPGARDR